MNAKTSEIICLYQEKGRVHDFSMFKKSIASRVLASILIQADSGYQGIQNFHGNSQIPKKKSKKKQLSSEEKAYNSKLSSERILVENINAKIKVFRCMSSRYRNRRNRHLLRMSLICGILNFELAV